MGTASLLLNAAGRQLGDLGFGLSRRGGDTDLRLDAHRTVLVFVYGFGAQLVVKNLLTLLPLPKSPPPAVHPTSAAFTAYAVAAAVSAGLREEVVVLGFLVSQLERAGSRPAAVVAIAVLVRVSFHAYYGVFTLAFAMWAVVFVLLYQRFRPRRLAPFIGAHVLWDLQSLLVAVLGNTAPSTVATTGGIRPVISGPVEVDIATERVVIRSPSLLAKSRITRWAHHAFRLNRRPADPGVSRSAAGSVSTDVPGFIRTVCR